MNLADVVHLSQRAGVTLDALIATAPAMRAVIDQARALADADTPLWISGESGVGKATLAAAIHGSSSRASGPLVELGAPAIPAEYLTAACFGAAPTNDGAAVLPGALEMARGGTLMLVYFDLLGPVGFAVQQRLVRALRSGWFRSGAGARVPLEARLIFTGCYPGDARTTRGGNLASLTQRCTELTVPPLRARPEDLDALTERFIAEIHAEYGGPAVRLTPEARSAIAEYDWPGNVRGLWVRLGHAVVLADNGLVTAQEIPKRWTP